MTRKKEEKNEYFLFWSLGTVLSQNMQLQYSNLLLITGEVGNVCKCIFLFVESILTLALRKTNEGFKEKLWFRWNSFLQAQKVLQEQLHLSEKKDRAALSRQAVTIE